MTVGSLPGPRTDELNEDASGGLGSQAAAGILWTVAQKWVIRIAGLVTLAILTRLVTPEEFGVVAAATTLLPFFYLISDAFSTYLVQSQRIDQRMLSTSFWFSLGASLVLMAATMLLAPLVSALLKLPDLTPVLRLLAASVLLSGLAAVPTALLRRRLAFRALAVQGVVSAAAAQVVAVVLALNGFGAWALVWQLLVMQGIAMLLAWRATRWTPTLAFSTDLFRSMGAFGARVSTAEFISSVTVWAQSAIVASVLGASALGYLSIAQRLVWVVQDLSASAVKPVSVVVFSKVRDTPDRLRSGYVRALSMAYSVVAPLLTVVAVTAPALVPLLFGGQWTTSVPLAQALAVAAILTLGAMLDQGLLYGLGRPGTWLAYAVVVDLMTVAVAAVAVQQGLSAVAVGFLGVALAATVARWVVVSRVIASPVHSVARPFMHMALTTALSAGTGLLAASLLPATWPLLLQVAAPSVVVLVVGLAVTRLTQPDVLAYAVQTLPLPSRLSRTAQRVLLLPESARP